MSETMKSESPEQRGAAPAPTTTVNLTVPVDPTDAMIEAALAADWECDGDEKAAAINVWHAMLAAASEGSGNG